MLCGEAERSRRVNFVRLSLDEVDTDDVSEMVDTNELGGPHAVNFSMADTQQVRSAMRCSAGTTQRVCCTLVACSRVVLICGAVRKRTRLV